MQPPGQPKKLGAIAFLIDEKLSREKSMVLTRIVNASKQFAEVELINGDATEDEVLKKLSGRKFHLLLLPWYRYLAWPRVEAFFGLMRTSGPTLAGYFCEPVSAQDLTDQGGHYLRLILLDFIHLNTVEAVKLIRILMHDVFRTGIKPLVESNSTIYCENWLTSQGMGARIDTFFNLPEIAENQWMRRATAIKFVLNSLWSLVYEDGPGKSEFAQTLSNKSPRAYFQIGIGRVCLAIRLCFSMPSWSPKDALNAFLPDPKAPITAPHLLLRYADFVRIHTLAPTQDIEVLVGFMVGAPAERAPDSIHTLWVEPIAASIVSEVPFEIPAPPNLKAFPAPIHETLRSSAATSDSTDKAPQTLTSARKDRFIIEASSKIRELKLAVAERETLIRELRAGGIGTAPPPPPPDADALLDAFQEKYFDARFKIRRFQLQIAELENSGASPSEVESLRKKMTELEELQKGWIKKIGKTLEAFRGAKQKASGTV